MSTKQTQSKAAIVEKPDAEKPEFMILKCGAMLLGAELLGDKLAAITAEAIKIHTDHGLASIVIRTDGYPADALGMAYADTYSIAINLERCWNAAVEIAEKGEENLSFLGMVWINVLSAIGHEMDHIDMATKDRELYEDARSTEEDNALLETAASEQAMTMIVALAKRFDIEIPGASELGWIGIKVMDLFTNDDTKDLEWVIKARKHMEKGIIYDAGEGEQCFTLREFIKMAHAENDDDEIWEQATTAVNLEAHLDSGAVEEFKAEPVIQPKINTVDLEQSEVEEVLQADEVKMVDGTDADGQPTIDMVKTTAGQFVGAGTDDNEPDVHFTDPSEQVVEAVEVPAAATVMPVITTPIENDGAGMAEAAAMEVPLPQPVAEQVAATTVAAATAVPPVQPTPTTYTPNSLTPEIMAAVMKSVWQVLYHHVFTKCGWQQNPQTGRFMFTNAAAVLEGVNIQHILAQYGAENFIMEYDTLSADGRYAPEMCQGMIRGRTTSQAGLPSYSLYLNINGQRVRRTFMPQNPEKMNAQNAYTNSANEAGGGHMIVWVFKDEAPDTAPFKEKVAVTIKDNVYEVMS